MAWHTYVMPPVDTGWERVQTVTDCATDIGMEEGASFLDEFGAMGYGLQAFRTLYESAITEARAAGYDGVARQAAAVFWLPVEDGFEPGFLIKQENNGTTFVVSPVRLPHLDR